jgi:hypothetical protein
MPRKQTLPATVQAAPHIIHPTAIYDKVQAHAALGLAAGTLAREVRLKRLRVSARGGRRYFLGRWLLEWIEGGELRRQDYGTNGTGGMQHE